uniref:HDC14423 n=1 Tax=Drosophila melanogaster TaxID=7227 RepID=Q6IJR0_DROME|nr:TPA_inf: HDC14423 [Drosophila melanogaster]
MVSQDRLYPIKKAPSLTHRTTDKAREEHSPWRMEHLQGGVVEIKLITISRCSGKVSQAGQAVHAGNL